MGIDRNNLKYTVLGLVAAREDGIHGYPLMRDLAAAVNHVPTVSTGGVYRLLAQLESEGSVVCERVIQDGKPNRKHFTATALGRRRLKEWLRQPIPPSPKPLEDEFSVRLLLQHELNVGDLAPLIGQQRMACCDRISKLRKHQTRLNNVGLDTELTELVIEGLGMQLRARLAWLERVERFVVRDPRAVCEGADGERPEADA